MELLKPGQKLRPFSGIVSGKLLDFRNASHSTEYCDRKTLLLFYCDTKDTNKKNMTKLLTIPLTIRNLYNLLYNTSLEYNSYKTFTVCFFFFFRLHTYVPQENAIEREFVSKILGKTREIVLFSEKSGKCCPFRKFQPEWKSPFVFSAEYIFLFGFIVIFGVHSHTHMIANIVFS